MAVARAHRNVSISLPVELADQLDAWTAADETTRSALVTDLVERERRRRLDQELEQAYQDAVADGFFDPAESERWLPLAAEVILANPWDEPEAR